MVIPVVILNLFVVPAVALWCYHKIRKTPFEPSVELLLEYAIFTACNVPLTKIAVFLIRLLADRDISLDSGYYTFLAICAAVTLGFLADLTGKYLKEAPIRQRFRDFLTKRTMKYRHKLLAVLPLVLLIVIAYVIRGPLEIYAKNMHELLFSLSDFLPWLCAIAVAALVLLSCLFALLPDKPFYIASLTLLWFGAVSWIQDLFLNTKLSEANGTFVDLTSLGVLQRKDWAVWLIILVFFTFLFLHVKGSWHSISRLIAGALCLIQLIAVGSVFYSMSEREAVKENSEKQMLLSGKDQMQLASEENVILIIMDSVGIDDLKNMRDQYPEAESIMKDFVFYNNICYDYSYTFPSLTHILTGNEVDFNAKANDWLRDSWNSDRCRRFYSILKELGYTVRLYNGSSLFNYIFGDIHNLEGKFDNIEEISEIDTALLLKKLGTMSVYRYLPYSLKEPFFVGISGFSDVIVMNKQPPWANSEFYQRLVNEGLSVDKKVDKLVSITHIEGIHEPWHTSAQAEWVEQSTANDATRGMFTILQEYFDQLKALGQYDKSTIIVMSDHSRYLNGRMSPMFYIKRQGEIREHTEINSAPAAYQDIQATILELVGHKDDSFGTSIFDWQAGQKRRRILYQGVIDDNYPKVKGLNWNRYHCYIYTGDLDELTYHYEVTGPDYELTAPARY